MSTWGDVKLKSGSVGDVILYNWGLRVNRLCKRPDFAVEGGQMDG